MFSPPFIVHLDADAFFVSCELAARPELRGRKVAVGGRGRGIISSASYEARAAGVFTPMPTARALRVCPDLVLLPHSGARYAEISRQMFALCETLTPLVERASIDEGYLDLGPRGFRELAEVEAAARGLQARIWADLGIPVSMGLASNKLVAQIASKLRKPRGFVVVPRGEEAAFIAPLAIGRLPGVGKKTEEVLIARGIARVGDLFGRGESELAALLGRGWREFLAWARGEDNRPVVVEGEGAKSYSQQETFEEDLREFEVVERVARRMVEELAPLLRADGKWARTLTVKVRYADFTQESASRSLAEPSDLESAFYPLIGPLLLRAWSRRVPVRLVGVRLSGLVAAGGQLDLFQTAVDEKRRRLAAAVDRLNAASGKLRVRSGGTL